MLQTTNEIANVHGDQQCNFGIAAQVRVPGGDHAGGQRNQGHGAGSPDRGRSGLQAAEVRA